MKDYTSQIQRWHVDQMTTEEIEHYFQLPDFAKQIRAFIKRGCTFEKTYQYMITFTIDPKKYATINDELIEKIEEYIKAIPLRTALKITKFEMVRESHKDGRPHWHTLVVSTKSLKKSLFTYYQKLYGNIDFSKSRVKCVNNIRQYISKSETPEVII